MLFERDLLDHTSSPSPMRRPLVCPDRLWQRRIIACTACRQAVSKRARRRLSVSGAIWTCDTRMQAAWRTATGRNDKSQVQVIARAARDPARARRPAGRLEPRADRPAGRSRALDGAAHRRRAGSREAGDRRLAHRAGCGSGRRSCGSPHRRAPISLRGAAVPDAAVAGAGRDRRSRHHQEATISSSSTRSSGRSGCARCRRSARCFRSIAPPTARPIWPQLDDVAIARLIGRSYERRTPNTITRLDALLAELKAVRKTGVAFDREEHTVGICAAGVVLRDLLGNDVAISVPVPAQRFERAPEAIIAARLLRNQASACRAAACSARDRES